MNKIIIIAASVLIGLGGCSKAPAPAPAPTPSTSVWPSGDYAAQFAKWKADHPGQTPQEEVAGFTAWRQAHPGATYP